MPRCSWCGAFKDRLKRVENGRSHLDLCELCAAQKEIADSPELKVQDLESRSLWDRIRRFFTAG
ncbi:MAG TPA: hypothetical protein VNO81_09430 [Candidatus Nitrosotenuis sp.]|jgi:hypothetical protein|nr:hypothetical protein [Candidatus Nitrosotenuis sp.]